MTKLDELTKILGDVKIADAEFSLRELVQEYITEVGLDGADAATILTTAMRGALENLKIPDGSMFAAAEEIYSKPSWTSRMLFEAIINAVLDNQP